jgi:hypothetical protein
MLADQICAEGAGELARALGVDHDGLAAAVRHASRFVLEDGVMNTALTARDTPADSRLRALALARFPFELSWFEWSGSALAGRRNQSMNRELHAPTPRRIGVLVTTDESMQRGMADYVWQHEREDGGVTPCPVRVTFDWRVDWEPPPNETLELPPAERLEQIRQIAHEHETQDARRAAILKSSPEALLEDNARVGFVVSPYWLNTLHAMDARDPAFARKMLREAGRDLTGECDILRSVVMVMNSRNLVALSPYTMPEKVARKRAREGKSPLLDHTEVRIRLSRALYARAGSGDTRDSPALHAVRGHFKARASGLYWWSPHMRGDAGRGTAPRRSYRVQT